MLLKLFLLGCCFLGHTGLWLSCFNRVNATGLPRRFIKVSEKSFILAWAILPIAIALIHWQDIADWALASDSLLPVAASPITNIYILICLLFCFVVGIPWIFHRIPLHFPPKRLIAESSTEWDVKAECGNVVHPGTLSAYMSRIPMNQIEHLELTVKQLHVPHLGVTTRPLRIGHVSDLHLTGGMELNYFRFAAQQLRSLKPDLVVVSGDLVDFDELVPMMVELAPEWHAPHGTYYVLGNHDRRLSDVLGLRNRLRELNWIDLSEEPRKLEINGGKVLLAGNESPWFARRTRWNSAGQSDHASAWELKVAVSHSPDQFPWALKLSADLLLCGHLHGGQARFPLIGPIVAPSWYGSRFASGLFEIRNQMLMHVSRGLGGIHPLRFHCCPEVTLLILSGSTDRVD